MNAAEQTIERLESTSQAWWLFSFLARMILALAFAIGLLQAVILVDVLFRLPSTGLWLLLGCWIATVVALTVAVIWKTAQGPRGVEATARRIEQAVPALGNDLINVVQLSRQADGREEGFYRAAVRDALGRLGGVKFEGTPASHRRWERFRQGLQTPRDVLEFFAVLLVVIAIAYGLGSFVPRWSSAMSRLLHPWSDIPLVGSVEILEVSPGDAEIVVGSGLEIRARIENPGRKAHRAVLYVRKDRQAETPIAMVANDANDTYVAAIPTVLEGFHYRLEVGDSQTRAYRIAVVAKPVVESVEIEYEFPKYLRQPRERVTQEHGDLEAPQFTIARLAIRASTPIAKGYVVVNGEEHAGSIDANRRTLHVRLFLKQDGSYTIHLLNKWGHGDSSPRVNQIRVMPDRPPTVQLVKPAVQSTVAPDSELAVALRAADDRGLESVRIETRVTGGEQTSGEGEEATAGQVRIAQVWDQLAGDAKTAVATTLHLSELRLEAGNSLLVRAVAVDGRRYGTTTKPQATIGPWHRVEIVAAEVQAAAELARIDALRNQLWEILRLQLKARIAAGSLPGELTTALGALRVVGGQQTKIYRLSTALVDRFEPQDDVQRQIRTAVGNLAHGPMMDAVKLCDAMATAKERDALSGQTKQLLAHQDRIIDVLRRLLGEARRATAETLAEMEQRSGGDLPADVQDKLRELKDKLEEFIKQQKKVIEATKNLAKIPVDDFTEQEEQLLKELAAIEDEWSRFLEDFHSDLSKLPEQDFSNASLLQELVEIQTEIKMAEGALTKKTADIAVPLEQLGAEMAEEMTTNIEKWLPDTPDRERWSQEEPLTDDMKEAPMAELPGELEDLVGELMEEEEDLFDEMEDVSSSWADSLDKGAGWDAADGPISNMSARGVTGNRLPNTSEIGGRSGEGRQGKSSGEFVGDTAVGKGGRKTPSRLTPDANVKGQVKDYSKDPVGGATGGGKESGQGGEGLEGPSPPRRDRELKRLAEKQAALRNKAESIDLKFKVLNYHDTDLKRLMEQMAAVEADLASGNYQTALRRRQVLLDSFKNMKVYLGGELEIRKDSTSSIPSDVQKEILGSMADASPAGWEELNRKYYEQLSAGKSNRREKPEKK